MKFWKFMEFKMRKRLKEEEIEEIRRKVKIFLEEHRDEMMKDIRNGIERLRKDIENDTNNIICNNRNHKYTE